MDVLDQITTWISENEALFSGMAAIVALFAIVPAALRPVLRRRKARGSQEESAKSAADKRKHNSKCKPRLAVFPIQVTGKSDELVNAAEIITVELTTLLARSHGCEVISRTSAAAFANRKGTTRDAGQELDVHYIIEGGIRTSGTALRISASLIDATQDKVIWSDVFEASRNDISSVSQSLAEKVASYLGVELTRAEIGRSRQRPRSRISRDLVLRARGIQFDEGLNRASFRHAAELLEKAITADPENADAHGLLALLMALSKNFGFVEPSDDHDNKMLLACRRALEVDDPSSEVLGFVGCAYCDVQRFEQGIPLLERAIELDPSNAQAKAALGASFVIANRLEEGAALIEEALRLSPAYKGIAAWATVLAGAYSKLDRHDEALASITQALRCDPTFYPTHLTAALLALKKGDKEAAERHAREAKRIDPEIDARATIRIVGPEAADVLAQWMGTAGELAS